jgi:hypothetical protein
MDTMTYASYGALRAIIAQIERIAPVSEPDFTHLELTYISAAS